MDNTSPLQLEDKLSITIKKAAEKLPGQIASQLLALITPQSLAIMAGVVTVWAVSHFFGVGFIADIILLTAGWIAIGGVAIEAASHLVDFGIGVYNANGERDLDIAADHLAKAVTLVGVDVVAVILLKKRPAETFKDHSDALSTYSNFSKRLSSTAPISSGNKFYKPTVKFTRHRDFYKGATQASGNILVGRHMPKELINLDRNTKHAMMLEVIYHERAHQFLAPKFYLLRELRAFVNVNSYHRSYLMRYLNEAFAQTYAMFRLHGLSREYIIQGLKFPLNGQYNITFSLLRQEALGVLLGPVLVSGVIYNVFYGMNTYDN